MEVFWAVIAFLGIIGITLLALLAIGVVAFDVWLTRWLFRWVIHKCEMTYAPLWAKGIVLGGIISVVTLATLAGGFVLAVFAGGAAMLKGLAGSGARRDDSYDHGSPEPRRVPGRVEYPYEEEIEYARNAREREAAERLAAREAAQRQERPHPAFETDHPAF